MKRQTHKKSIPAKPDTHLNVDHEIELMKFLIEVLPHKSRQNIKSLLSKKQIVVNNRQVSQFNFLLHTGDDVTVKWVRNDVAQNLRGFSIVFEDEHLIVIDKHAGILSMATQSEKDITVYNFLKQYVKSINPSNKIFIVHRLDRDTSGLMIYAKTAGVQKLLQENWKEMVERIYVAVIEGEFEEKNGVITSYLHENNAMVVYSDQNPEEGKKAVTNYRVLKTNRQYSLLEVKLDTGRKNQIRVHMQEAGHPIISDKKYGSTVNPIDRLGLHSRTISFIHPITRQSLRFSTPIPRKFLHLFNV